MKNLLVLGTLSLLTGGSLLILEAHLRKRFPQLNLRLLRPALTVCAASNVVFVVFLWTNHVTFPLNLEIMEGTILQHVQRVISMLPVYPSPSPDYVPLSYNPLYYVLAVPFTFLGGIDLTTLRLLTIIATIGSSAILWRVVGQKTGSRWWGLVAVGLFAASYHAMDHFFDVAHPDMWMLFSVLVGTSVIGMNRSRAWNLLAVVILALAFWFKQHGAWFAVGGVLYLTWREGWKRSIPYWLVALLIGPVLYFSAGPSIFGSHFHYFTLEMPRGWMELNLGTARVFVGWVLKNSPLMSLAAVGSCGWMLCVRREDLDVWAAQFAPALFCGSLGALDPGSSYNNYIPMGTWFILLGTAGLAKISNVGARSITRQISELVLVLSFGVLIYNPTSVIVPGESTRKYEELVAELKGLPGPVYAPSIGQMQSDFAFHPTVNWVALEDMVRGPGKELRNQPITRRLLEPVIAPPGDAFILAYHPLTYYPWIAFLDEYYVLEKDFGEYYSSLGVLRVRYDHGFPRYIYRFSPKKAPSRSADVLPQPIADSGADRE